MADTFALEIITPQSVYTEKAVEYLSVETTKGALGIMAHHTDMIAELPISPLTIKTTTKETLYAISGGTLNIIHDENKVRLFVYAIESSSEIDLDRALKAKDIATGILEKSSSPQDIARAQIKIKRAMNRIKVSEMQK